MTRPISQYIEPITKETTEQDMIRKVEENLRRMQLEIWQLSQQLSTQSHISDADGTLASATSRINAILVALETAGILSTS